MKRISLDRFSKNAQISNFKKIRLVGIELFHTDGQTDMTELIGAYRKFPNAPKNWLLVYLCVSTSLPHLILRIDMYKRYVIGGHCKLVTRSFVRS
jgi:hypothetical protein